MTPRPAVSRQLSAFPCSKCEATLLLHDQERAVICVFCETANVGPDHLVADLDHGKKLPTNYKNEMTEALDAVVEERFLGFELSRRTLLIAGALGAAFFAWVYHDVGIRPELADYGVGAAIGFFAILMPLGWTSSWLATTGLGRAAYRSYSALSLDEKECPECARPIMQAATAGRFECPGCGEGLVITETLIIRNQSRRVELFTAAAQDKLADQPWLKEDRGGWKEYVGLAVMVAGIVTSLYFAMTLSH